MYVCIVHMSHMYICNIYIHTLLPTVFAYCLWPMAYSHIMQVRNRGVDLRTCFEETRLEKPPAYSEASSNSDESGSEAKGSSRDLTIGNMYNIYIYLYILMCVHNMYIYIYIYPHITLKWLLGPRSAVLTCTGKSPSRVLWCRLGRSGPYRSTPSGFFCVAQRFVAHLS